MKPFVAIFPGQGSQYPGMGRDLAADPAAAAVFAEADASLGEPLSATCFAGTEEALARTETTQPAILTVAVAAFRVYLARGGQPPGAAAGHSLGEYAAHVAAGTVSFGEAVATVRRRGRFMQEAVPAGTGAMAAILGLDRAVLERLCDEEAKGEVVSCANFNGAGQIVVAGHAAAVARVVQAASAAGARRALPLPVSAPFHCALMEPAARRLAEVLERVLFSEPEIPVYTNVDAAPLRDAAGARDALVRQVASCVRWEDEVVRMVEDGYDTFIEFGPGKVLSNLVRRIRKDAVVLAVSDRAGVDAALAGVEA